MTELQIHQGDITAQSDVDVVVNAANAQLRAGAGVCGAIASVGGQSIFDECAAIIEGLDNGYPLSGSYPIGGSVLTGAGNLPNKAVAHAVGPVYAAYTPAGAQALLASAYVESVKAAAAAGHTSIAFPALSCGIYGYPISEAASVAVKSAVEAAESAGLDTVRFVLFSDEDYETFLFAAAGHGSYSAQNGQGDRMFVDTATASMDESGAAVIEATRNWKLNDTLSGFDPVAPTPDEADTEQIQRDVASTLTAAQGERRLTFGQRVRALFGR